MNYVIVEIANYVFVCIMALYVLTSFLAFKNSGKKDRTGRIAGHQMRLFFLFHLAAYVTIYAVTYELDYVIFYFLQVIFFIAVMLGYHLAYPTASKILVNHMCMLLAIGFIMLTRLSTAKAIKQFAIALAAFIISMFIPVVIKKFKVIKRMTWIYAGIGVIALLSVYMFGATSSGAKLSISIAGIAIQPSEFVKILFVFFVACVLRESTDILHVAVASAVAAVHVVILAASRDLGGALIFFVVYLIMLYAASRNLFYLASGIVIGCIASVAAYNMFSHVRVRVLAWKDPLSVAEDAGYQVSQSLFGIGTGGWKGMGLFHGMPEKIPLVDQDFIFAGISEELGGAFSVCLMLVCISCFFMMLNIAMQMKDKFYKLTALGLGTVYGFEVFLNIGGNIKFIPSTGITLPLVSYGGSSLLCTIIIFAIIQGMYILRGKGEAETADAQTADRSSAKGLEFIVTMVIFLAMFAGMVGYFVYFITAESDEFINSSYNGRQSLLSATVVRGSILSADGDVLAETVTDSEGNETRNYPYGRLFAHIVGYSEKGRTGIESLANMSLLRSNVDFLKRASNEIQGDKSPGDDVYTTLDVDVQQSAFDTLRYYQGAVVVMEPSTGKILAMVSRPDYDPNTIADDWEVMTAEDHSSSELLNRATQGLYPPGSTFKIFTTLEYLIENDDPSAYSFTCSGRFSLNGETIHCYSNESHGTLDLKESFAHSCNSSFANLGSTLDITQFKTLCNSLLFNSELPTKLAYSESSFVLDESDDTADILQTSIGQGKTLVTPFHMALIASAIANDGVLMEPYVISSVKNADGETVTDYQPSTYGRLISEENAAVLQEYMRAVVEEGTADELASCDYEVYGKTGSAEFSSDNGSSHSWFVGYAHREDKEDIAIAVIIENSGLGSEFAVPVAKKIFDAYYED